jgi:hypothetical protein
MPCECNHSDDIDHGIEEPDVSQVLESDDVKVHRENDENA